VRPKVCVRNSRAGSWVHTAEQFHTGTKRLSNASGFSLLVWNWSIHDHNQNSTISTTLYW